MNRPPLTPRLASEEFRRFYWLKEELVNFCRANGLPTMGGKEALAHRIEIFLRTGQAPDRLPRPAKPAPAGKMPNTFARDTVIGAGWHCSQALRAFFEREIGAHFHFNGVMRDFIKHGAGKTLQQAIAAWETSQQPNQPETPIAPQFEYNRHIRAYFKAHPGATLQDAIQAWKEHKAKRRE